MDAVLDDLSGQRWSASVKDEPVPPEKLADQELVLLCQQRSQPHREAFAELIRRYQAYVDKVLYHLAPSWPDRQDLAQEVWIRAYRNLKHLQEPAKFRSWLGRIATNLFYDELRKRKRQQPTLSLDASISRQESEMEWELPSNSPGPHDHLTTCEFYERLHQAVHDLPEVFRQALLLREIQGMAYEEIAEITGVSLGTVKSRIARARARLQSILKPYLNGE
ncbi:sigma-70 family RNA polymerase sigma factor [Synechococcus sp. H65.1]|uniref:sigma-70 family RNA polymerase sigma factor n=1 Tax=unclassified Synechococcus TaxID=2626047 RepID=UPI0039C1D7E5